MGNSDAGDALVLLRVATFRCASANGIAHSGQKQKQIKCDSKKMRLNSSVNLALHCGSVLSTTQGRCGGTRTSVLRRPATKNQHFLNTSRVCAICIPDTATGKLLCLLRASGIRQCWIPDATRGRMPVLYGGFTACLLIKDSDRTIVQGLRVLRANCQLRSSLSFPARPRRSSCETPRLSGGFDRNAGCAARQYRTGRPE